MDRTCRAWSRRGRRWSDRSTHRGESAGCLGAGAGWWSETSSRRPRPPQPGRPSAACSSRPTACVRAKAAINCQRTAVRASACEGSVNGRWAGWPSPASSARPSAVAAACSISHRHPCVSGGAWAERKNTLRNHSERTVRGRGGGSAVDLPGPDRLLRDHRHWLLVLRAGQRGVELPGINLVVWPPPAGPRIVRKQEHQAAGHGCREMQATWAKNCSACVCV